MKTFRYMLASLLLLFVMAGGILAGGAFLRKNTVPYRVNFVKADNDFFRRQQISEENLGYLRKLSKECKASLPELLAALMATRDYQLDGGQLKNFTAQDWNDLKAYLNKSNKKEYDNLVTLYSAIWQDIQYFPVPESTVNPKATVSFEDSWMYERNFGGKRGHEGTDLMANVNKRGYYPVISMTDGVVEQIGWLTKGGYRIGIRSSHGGYFYYAHLYSYAQEFQKGDVIQAGQLIGYMGDSGYGGEGTVGQFPVHLHVGIYLNNENGEETSVNPYAVLKYFEENTLQYSY